MKNYSIIVLIEQEETRAQHWCIRMEESDFDMLALVRSIVDACRCLLWAGAHVPAVIVWEVEGPLTAFSKLSVYQSDHLPETPNYKLLGANQNSPYNEWTGFKIVRNAEIGRGVNRFVAGVLGPVDMARFREGPHLNISTDAPLWQVAFPMFAAFLDQWPDLDAIDIKLDGTVTQRPALTSGWKIGNPEHHHKQHLKWERLTIDDRHLRGRIAQACREMRRAVLRYQRAAEVFDHRWRDNHTPPNGHYADYWMDAVNNAALWFDLAHAMGYTIPDPNKGYGFHINRLIFNSNDGIHGNFDTEHWSDNPVLSPFTPDAHAGIVESCIQALWSAQRTLEAERALCEAEFARFPGNGTHTKDEIAALTNQWGWFVPYGEFGVRLVIREQDPKPVDHPEAFLYRSRCQRQREAEAQYNARGGAAYGIQCARSWDAMSDALMLTSNALHLLLTFCFPKPMDAATWARNGNAASVVGEGVHRFSRVEPVPQSYDLLGQPCDFVDVRPWDSAPWVTEFLPCSDAVAFDRLPYPPHDPPGNGVFWDNSIHVDNLGQAISTSVVVAVQGHREQAHIFLNPRTGQYRIGENFPPPESEGLPTS